MRYYDLMLSLGLAITGLTTAVLVITFFRHRKFPLPAYGWPGLIALIAAEALLFHGFQPLAIYFTPVAWTCYILLADSAVYAIRGHSRLHSDPSQFASIAALSIPLWLIFEAYNLRLNNWVYTGVPQAWPFALLGYGWSFATITPGIFETADLIASFGWFHASAAPVRLSAGAQRALMFFGALCLIIPLVLPRPLAARLFFLVWIGFVFLLDPINHRHGLPSLIGNLGEGRRDWFYSLLASGFVCGWLWEFWNYWATAQWHYIFPMFQRWKIFEMPAPGYLGFLPFALECFVMYVTTAWLLRLPSVRA
ncbi:MAG TPA: hypothetical protein VEI52_25065 [Terriglobales bacterium]|nr:hypothetical protein [Terriglobales bacterium]